MRGVHRCREEDFFLGNNNLHIIYFWLNECKYVIIRSACVCLRTAPLPAIVGIWMMARSNVLGACVLSLPMCVLRINIFVYISAASVCDVFCAAVMFTVLFFFFLFASTVFVSNRTDFYFCYFRFYLLFFIYLFCIKVKYRFRFTVESALVGWLVFFFFFLLLRFTYFNTDGARYKKIACFEEKEFE